jgi:hypothetical protein
LDSEFLGPLNVALDKPALAIRESTSVNHQTLERTEWQLNPGRMKKSSPSVHIEGLAADVSHLGFWLYDRQVGSPNAGQRFIKGPSWRRYIRNRDSSRSKASRYRAPEKPEWKTLLVMATCRASGNPFAMALVPLA